MLPTTIANLTNPAPNEDMLPTAITDLTNPAPNEDMVADPNDFFFTGDEPAPPTDQPTDETPPSTVTPPAATDETEDPGDRIDFNDSGFDFNNNVGGPNMGIPFGVGGSPSFFGGTFANRGGFTPGSFAPIAGGASILPYQLAMFHGIWSGAKPMSYDTWRASQAWQNYQGSPFGNRGSGGIGGSYQNYINTWNSLRSAGVSAKGTLQSAAAATAERSGAGPGGAGRPMTVAR
jgi:hypothetical protein